MEENMSLIRHNTFDPKQHHKRTDTMKHTKSGNKPISTKLNGKERDTRRFPLEDSVPQPTAELAKQAKRQVGPFSIAAIHGTPASDLPPVV
jgi:hypothetical protein